MPTARELKMEIPAKANDRQMSYDLLPRNLPLKCVVVVIVIVFTSCLFVLAQSAQQNALANVSTTESPLAPPSVEVLSDASGVDLSTYLNTVVRTVRSNWHALMPAKARDPEKKQGKVSIGLTILRNGKIVRAAVSSSSGDEVLDRAALGSILASSPLLALPAQLTAANLILRLNFQYNPVKPVQQSITDQKGEQESTNSALLEKSRQALTKRDYTHALELLKQVDPARPERATMLAVANGMACQTHGVVSEQDPSADAQCALAKQFFTQLLRQSPQDGLALSWLGALSFAEPWGMEGPARLAKLDEVRSYFTTLLAAHPDDLAMHAESDYWLGVTAWIACYQRSQDARADYNRNAQIPLQGNDPLPEAVRIELARQCGDMVNQGIAGLQRRVDQQTADVYSLAWLNLLFRRRVELQQNAEMRAKDLRMADELVSRIQELKKSKVLVMNIPFYPAVPPPPPPPPPPTQPE
jgi:TonB family protein